MPPNNPLTVWGNEKTMNLNTLILTNIQSSPYFKVNLFELKTYHEVIDEIYYKVNHLEPWEKGSRKTAGQTGMCGGVRGVGAGGIVSSAYCLLYKLFTLKLTKKQVIGLITHADSPYIRGLGFMYIRYTQPPGDLWDWYEEYLDDEEEIDVKAGGGHVMTVGEMLRQWLVKLEWYSTLFPRIPVPIEKDLAAKLKTRPPILYPQPEPEPQRIPDNQVSFGEAERRGGDRFQDPRSRGRSPPRSPSNSRQPRTSPTYRSSPSQRRSSPSQQTSSSHRTPPRENNFQRDLERERERQRREVDDRRERDRDREGKERDRDREGKERDRDREKERDRKQQQSRSRERRDKKHKDRKEKGRARSRSREKMEEKFRDHGHRSKNSEKEHKHKEGDRHRSKERDHRR